MGRRHRKGKNKSNRSSNNESVNYNRSDELRIKANIKSSKKKIEETEPKKVTPIRTANMQGLVPYHVLFPNKIKTGAEIAAAYEKYFSVPREKHDFNSVQKDMSTPGENSENEENMDEYYEEELPDIFKVSSKKHLITKFKGGIKKKPKCNTTRLKGLPLPRDPVFQLRPLPEPPHDIWWPPVPGVEVPEEDGMEQIGNMNKPWPRDPEVEARLKKMPMPSNKDIYDQFMSKKAILPVPDAGKWTPEEMKEIMRTRTTREDLKHFLTTGELIVRE